MVNTLQVGVQTIPLTAIAAIAVSSAFIHAHVFWRRRSSYANLLFACCCMTISVYAAGFAAQLCLVDVESVLRADHLQFLAVNLFAPSLIWFVHLFIRRPASRLTVGLTVLYLLLFLASLLGPRAWTIPPEVHVGRLINYPFGEPSDFIEVDRQGPVGLAQIIMYALSIPYLMGISLRHLRQQRSARAYLLVLTMAIVCLSASNDIAVILGWLPSLYCTVYSFLFVVIFMGHALVLEVADAATLKDILKEKNERMKMALRGGRLAFWDWYPKENKMQMSRMEETSEADHYVPWSNLMDWRGLIWPADASSFSSVTQPCLAGKQDRFETAVRLRVDHQNQRWALIQGRVFERDGDGRSVRISGTMVDITQIKQLEEAHQQSEGRALSLLEGVGSYLFILVADSSSKIHLARGGWRGDQPMGQEGAAGLVMRDVEPTLEPATWRRRASAVMKGHSVLYQTEFRDNGRRAVPVEGRASPIIWQGQAMILIIARDISAQKLSEQRLNEAAEAERNKLGEELHDGIGQYLTAISYRSNILLKRAGDRGWPCVNEVEELVKLSALLSQETRLLSRSLQAIHLVERGLLPAVQEVLEFYRQHYDVMCILNWDRSFQPMNKTRELHVYRFLQEALNNAFKHGAAQQVSIKFAVEQGRARVEVANTGKAWTSTSAEKLGMGLQNMRRRALLLGGGVTIEHPAEGGGRLVCSFPFVPRDAHEVSYESIID